MVNPPILVALDLPTAEEAVRIAKAVQPYVAGFKIGLGLLHGPGPATISALAELGRPVFADAKLHDIPSQVERAAFQLGALGARWVTAHAGGGAAMLEAAVSGLAAGSDGHSGVLGVTVLTSLDEASLAAVGIPRTPGQLVSRMARVVDGAGCEGVVCSPLELGVIAEVAPSLVKVTPGIRPVDVAAGDQARISTPAEALGRGADYLVVGRAITRAQHPADAAASIAESIAGVGA